MKLNLKLVFAQTLFTGIILSFNFVNAQTTSWKLSKTTDAVKSPEHITREWKPVDKKRISEGFNPEPTWLKAEFENPGNDTATYYWVISNTYIDTVDCWLNGKHVAQTGLSFPFEQRPMESECFVLPVKTAPHEAISVHTRLAIKSGSLTSKFFLFDKAGLDKWFAARNRFNAIYLALFLNVFLIALVVSLVSRRNIMIYYAMYLFAFILFQLQTLGYAYHYLWPDFPFAAFFGKGMFQLFACFFFWLFCAEITGYSKLEQLISFRLRKALLGFLPLTVLCAVVLNATGNYHALCYLVIISSFAYILTGFIDLFICVRHNFRPAYGVFVALCFPVASASVVMLRGGNMLRDWAFLDYAYPVGFMTEVVLLLLFTVYFLRRQNRYQALQELRFHYHQDYLKKILPELKHFSSKTEVQEALSQEIAATQSYSVEQLEKDFSLLSMLLTEQKLYTNAELSLQSLSKQAGVPFSRASRCINLIAKKNFSEWLNEFRVAEAKTLLHSSATEKYTIEAIAQMAGFGSRSNFYSVFKRLTNYSPSDYKNMREEKEDKKSVV